MWWPMCGRWSEGMCILFVAASILNVRVGTGHLDFVRVVLDLDGRPKAEVRAEGARIRIRLSGGASREWRERRVDHPPVSSVRWSRGEAEIVLNTPSRFRQFVLERPWRLVVDVRRPEGGARLCPGVEWRRERVGEAVVNVLRVDPKVAEVRPVLAGGGIRGRASVGVMAEREGAVAAVNGGYFDTKSGEVVGMLVLFREWFKSPDVGKSAFLVPPDGRPRVSRCRFVGAVRVGDTLFPLEGINVPQPASEALVAYNFRYGRKCPWSKVGATRVVVEGGVVRRVMIASRAIPIPRGGWVISATGRLGWRLASVAREGMEVKFFPRLEPGPGEVIHARGAGPMLVEGGREVVGEAIREERVGPQPNRRRARTAIGIDSRGRVLLVAVERVPGWSEGATLFELAEILRGLGAVKAMNLDGGGSTMMLARGEKLVEPEGGRERLVTDAIVVLPQRFSLREVADVPFALLAGVGV